MPFLVVLCAALLSLSALAVELAPAPQSADPAISEALRHEQGDGVARNSGRAAEMYCAAARQGNADAAYRLGWLYANGSGIERNDRHAAALFRHAAALGHALAPLMLDALDAREARQPLCLALEPPPAVSVERETDYLRPVPSARETAGGANDDVTGAAIAARIAAVARAQKPAPPAEEQVMLAIARWAAAWSLRQVDHYLAAYASDLRLPAGESRLQWERRRRARIAEKAWIEIGIRDLAIAVQGEVATARFVQDYRSDKGKNSVTKTLTLAKADGAWLIRQEQASALPRSSVPGAASRQ